MKVKKFYFVILLYLFILPPAPSAQVFDIGPAFPHRHLRSIDWDNLQPGDVVQIHTRPEPYREKLIIRPSGTRKHPIIIRGISDKDGRRPILDGEKALGFQKTEVGLSRRALIIIGGHKNRADYITIDNLELRNANNKQQFFYDNKPEPYAANGAAVFVQNGQNVTIRNCHIHSCCMGVQTAYYPNVDNFILRGNYIHNNGDFTRQRWGHNVYLQGRRTLIEFNRFGEMYSDGNNIKDRSQAVVIRYNWIQGGMSRQIDLVETSHYPVAHAWVYGNVIISGKHTRNPKMILFGGDLPKKHLSRSGTLYFFNNTVHFTKTHMDAFIYINRKDCSTLIVNNAFLGGGLSPRITMGPAYAAGAHNMIARHALSPGFANTIFGSFEQFQSIGRIGYVPHAGSMLVNQGTSQLPAKIKYMPAPIPGRRIPRPKSGLMDIGAYEYMPHAAEFLKKALSN